MTTNPATDPLIGRMIDQRYRVRSRIARGGMATVYLATDVRLERRVAIKIMHGHLADDEAFRSRFMQEARSAARLSHPNLVGVYDQGSEDDCTYIVMEYIPGMTLRDLLQEHRALTSDQALDILRAVLAGLASAHRAGIVHRDLKPENVLLADDGRIKLGDFGLARAATANTATGAALLGTIAYLSPELVTRGQADTRSDIYALGIMLYEMLTGEQPYKGDQPMQIAYQHANEVVPAPSLAVPTVPEELDDLVRWATERDPNARPRDAREMLDRVDEIAHLRRTAVLPRPGNTTTVLPESGAHPDGRGGRAAADASAQAAQAAAAAGGAAAASAAGGYGYAPAAAHADTGSGPTTQFGEWASPDESPTVVSPRISPNAPTTTVPPVWPNHQAASHAHQNQRAEAIADGRVLTPAGQRLADKSARRRKRGWIVLAVIVVLALIGGGVGVWFRYGPGADVRIPAVAGKSVAQATAILEAEGLHALNATTTRYDATIAKGAVSTTKPAPRHEVKKGASVQLVLSAGPRMVTLPAIVGQPLSTVHDALAPNFDLQENQYQFDQAAPNTVIAATGRGANGATVDLTTVTTYAQHGLVTLTVSLGPVPNVDGKSLADATETLEGVGLVVGTSPEEQYSDTVPDGAVISSSSSDDPVVKGSTIDLVVSKGPPPITLPDVTGKTIDQAASSLQALGLKVTYPDCTNVLCHFYDWKATLPVSGTNPAPQSTVHKGDTITLEYEQ